MTVGQVGPDIIGFAGDARAGKDYAARIAAEFARRHEENRFVCVRSLAFALKGLARDLDPELDALVEMVGWEAAKDEYHWVRPRLVVLGEAVRNHLGPNAWIDACLRGHKVGREVTIVSDVRYINEANAILNRGGAIVVLYTDREPTGEAEVADLLDNANRRVCGNRLVAIHNRYDDTLRGKLERHLLSLYTPPPCGEPRCPCHATRKEGGL